jgi:hypothetical protein
MNSECYVIFMKEKNDITFIKKTLCELKNSSF